MEREIGFYWLKSNDIYYIGEYDGNGGWGVPGDDRQYFDKDFQWIDKPENRIIRNEGQH